jgi:hypothetical protein
LKIALFVKFTVAVPVALLPFASTLIPEMRFTFMAVQPR